MIVETLVFRPAAGTDEPTLLEADRRVQVEYLPSRRGFLRRTTARAAGGEWLVVTLWATDDDAVAAEHDEAGDPVAAGFLALADTASVRRARYETLD